MQIRIFRMIHNSLQTGNFESKASLCFTLERAPKLSEPSCSSVVSKFTREIWEARERDARRAADIWARDIPPMLRHSPAQITWVDQIFNIPNLGLYQQGKYVKIPLLREEVSVT